ncbi:MAG TPA: PilZ domain-containing protein [Allosphingosinicella sp.]|nr:PilZ domain-containing protein [Allosphingosinicella sp.]
MSERGTLDRLTELFAGNRRAEPRYSVLLSGQAFSAAGSGSVIIRDLSLKGAQIEGGSLPPLGRLLILKKGALEACGRIAWREGNRAGLRFEHPISAESLFAVVDRARGRRVPEAVAA